MVAAYPALIKQVKKDGQSSFEGFLPGFEFAQISDIYDEDEIVEKEIDFHQTALAILNTGEYAEV